MGIWVHILQCHSPIGINALLKGHSPNPLKWGLAWRIIPDNHGDRKSPIPGVVGPLPNDFHGLFSWGFSPNDPYSTSWDDPPSSWWRGWDGQVVNLMRRDAEVEQVGAWGEGIHRGTHSRGSKMSSWWQLNCFLFSPRTLQRWSNLTIIFFKGKNHQLDIPYFVATNLKMMFLWSVSFLDIYPWFRWIFDHLFFQPFVTDR